MDVYIICSGNHGKEKRNMEVKVLSKMNVLNKLQLGVGLIFVFMALGILLIFVNYWAIGAALAIIGYIMTFVLMIKLLLAKKL